MDRQPWRCTVKSPLFYFVAAVVAAPLALALAAFFSALWQERTDAFAIHEEELGT